MKGEEVWLRSSWDREWVRLRREALLLLLVLRKRFEATGEEENLQPEEEEAVPVPEAEEVAATCSDEAKLGRTRKRDGGGREKVVAQLFVCCCFFLQRLFVNTVSTRRSENIIIIISWVNNTGCEEEERADVDSITVRAYRGKLCFIQFNYISDHRCIGRVVENKCLSISQRIVILVLFPKARFVTVIMIFARSFNTFIHSTRTASSFKAKHANYIEIMQVNVKSVVNINKQNSHERIIHI